MAMTTTASLSQFTYIIILTYHSVLPNLVDYTAVINKLSIMNLCLQAGGSTVGTVFHKLTKPEHQMPSTVNHTAYWAFWGVNMLLSIVPQIVAIRLLWLPVQARHQVQHEKQKTNSKGQEKQKKSSKKLKEN
jgi:hypothetical protein